VLDCDTCEIALDRTCVKPEAGVAVPPGIAGMAMGSIGRGDEIGTMGATIENLAEQIHGAVDHLFDG